MEERGSGGAGNDGGEGRWFNGGERVEGSCVVPMAASRSFVMILR